jgi:hypothetical protein
MSPLPSIDQPAHSIGAVHAARRSRRARVASSIREISFAGGETMTTLQDELTGETLKGPPTEGRIATEIEKRTARVPSDVFLWTALGSMAGSLALTFLGKQKLANFVGQWVPTLLIFGLYNKIVKVAGHDQFDTGISAA